MVSWLVRGVKMGFESVESSQILKEAENIGDEIRDEVIKWDYFAKNTVGKQTNKL